MRGKRAKQYRKLMHQYGITFGFREPYQVLRMSVESPSHSVQNSMIDPVRSIVDAQIIMDAARYKMDLVRGLERTLQGQVKPSMFPINGSDEVHMYHAEIHIS
jgi:U3 small nucleolar RNA-associated protein 23